jgi:23S rRNA pseudouridine2605 synthase
MPVLREDAPRFEKSAHHFDFAPAPETSPLMPRDGDKHNDSRGRPDRPPGRKGRSGVPRGPEKKFAKRGFAGKTDGEKSPTRKPYSGAGKAFAGKRDDRTPRFARDDRSGGKGGEPRKGFGSRHDRGGEKQGYSRADRPKFDRDDRAPRGRFQDRKFGDKRRSFGDRPDRGDEKPWQKPRQNDRDERRAFDKPKFSRFRHGEPRQERDGNEAARFSKASNDRRSADRPFRERPKFDSPRERPKGRTDWQEHPRSEGRALRHHADRPRRDNEDDSKIFAKRKAFGGRGAYRERGPEQDRPARSPGVPPGVKKSSERIAKVMSRAGLASRRDAEQWIVQGRVTVNGRLINSPALDVTANDVITVDGKPLPPRERTRLFLYHKPRGLMTTHADPEGRPTVFDNLPAGLPRLISVGRLDFNTEGLLLMTNDGGLARALELPETGWLRRYRVRAHGEVTQGQLDALKNGVEVDGVKYGPIDATLERDQGANVWLVFAIREGKNREVRNVMAHLGLEVNRLIRVSYGPFQLAELGEGKVEEVRTRVLREQLGAKIASLSGADFDRPIHGEVAATPEQDEAAMPSGNKPLRPAAGKSGLIADRKGRRVLVQRTGSEEARARNEAEANGYGPPRRPRRGYHGKRDLKPRDE